MRVMTGEPLKCLCSSPGLVTWWQRSFGTLHLHMYFCIIYVNTGTCTYKFTYRRFKRALVIPAAGRLFSGSPTLLLNFPESMRDPLPWSWLLYPGILGSEESFPFDTFKFILLFFFYADALVFPIKTNAYQLLITNIQNQVWNQLFSQSPAICDADAYLILKYLHVCDMWLVTSSSIECRKCNRGAKHLP